MTIQIVTVSIAAEDDVVRARQIARTIAGAIGYLGQDQTRIATAVSEVARNAFMYAGGGLARFTIDDKAVPATFEIAIEDRGPGIADLEAVLDGTYVSKTGMGLGLRGAQRLMDACTIDSKPGAGTRIVLRKMLPKRGDRPNAQIVATLTQRLAAEMPPGPLVQMREQNRELMESLDELRLRQDELAQLNRELADTNRGVVALYAELDDKAEHLRRASDMKTRFLSNMTHELRTPINSILALSRMLHERTDGDLTPEQERQVGFIRQSAESLSEIINDLLDLAKVEAGRIDLKPGRFTATELLGALRGMFRPLLRDSVALVIEEPAAIELFTDEGKLSQILRNFVSNALKFTERGTVTVSAAASPDDTVTFTVRDTGIGIAAADISYIFEEFAQLDNPLQAKAKGTGLGLPLSKRLAELLGGHVAVSSEPGVGSVFSVTVPRLLHGAASMPASPSKTVRVATGSSRRVLVVDDDDAARYVAAQAVRQLGGQVAEAANGMEALALALRDNPQLILADLRMPTMDGFQLLRHLRDDARTASIPVVIVTSSAITEAERSRLAGVDAIISKAEFSAAALARWLAPQVRHELQTQGG